MEEEEKPLVVDNGSGFMKAGFGGDDAPRVVFPTVVGRRRLPQAMAGMSVDTWVGDEALIKRGTIAMTHPIERGLLTAEGCGDMEKIWHHTYYNELRVQPEEHAVVFTKSVCQPPETGEWMTQVQFETFNVPAFHINCQSLFALFASGRDTGTVLHSGEHTCAVPILEGEIQKSCVRYSAIGGRDITDYLNKLLRERGYEFVTRTDMEIVRDIKEKLCFVSTDFDADLMTDEITSDFERSYELPDGTVLTIGSERFRCCEALFTHTPDVEYSSTSLPQMVCDSINACAEERRKQLFANVLLAGGNTMFPAMDARLCPELVKLKRSVEVKVSATAERKYSAWIGASIVCVMPSFQTLWFTKEEYDEMGPTLAYRKGGVGF